MTIEISTKPKPTGRRSLTGKQNELRTAISALRVDTDDSFHWPTNRDVYAAAYSVGARVATRKDNGRGWIVWRTK